MEGLSTGGFAAIMLFFKNPDADRYRITVE